MIYTDQEEPLEATVRFSEMLHGAKTEIVKKLIVSSKINKIKNLNEVTLNGSKEE